jgi:biopolymer transport protein ExbB/TolQ
MEHRRNKDMTGLLVSLGVVVSGPLVGILVTILFLRRAFATAAAADPSEKARVLAELISESMNATAFGLAVSVFALIPAVLYAVRLYSKPTGAPGP